MESGGKSGQEHEKEMYNLGLGNQYRLAPLKKKKPASGHDNLTNPSISEVQGTRFQLSGKEEIIEKRKDMGNTKMTPGR